VYVLPEELVPLPVVLRDEGMLVELTMKPEFARNNSLINRRNVAGDVLGL
jgi:hypothetical protein